MVQVYGLQTSPQDMECHALLDNAASRGGLEAVGNHYKPVATDMRRAVEDGHVDIVRFLLENRLACSYSSLIWIAALRGHVDVVEYLLLHYNGVFSPRISVDRNGDQIVLVVVQNVIHRRNMSISIVDFTLKQTNLIVNPKVSAKIGYSSFIQALCKAFVSNLDCRRSNMQRAVEKGYLNIVRFLLENIPSCFDLSLIWSAAIHGHLDVLEYLVYYNGDFSPRIYVEKKSGQIVSTPIQRVIRKGNNSIAIVDFMLKHTKLDVNSNPIPTKYELFLNIYTPLIQAVAKGDLDLVRYLILEGGARINLIHRNHPRDQILVTALSLAIRTSFNNRSSMIGFLIQCGGQVAMIGCDDSCMHVNVDDLLKDRMLISHLTQTHQGIRNALMCTPLCSDVTDIVASYIPLMEPPDTWTQEQPLDVWFILYLLTC
jgi:ankyrin repeat protein